MGNLGVILLVGVLIAAFVLGLVKLLSWEVAILFMATALGAYLR